MPRDSFHSEIEREEILTMATMRPISEAGVRAEYARLTQEIQSTEHHLARLRAQRDVELRARAAQYGHAKVLRACEHPEPISQFMEEPTLRARVLESFSGQWRGMPYDAPAGTVADFPASYVKHATTQFEIVPPTTPLYRPTPGPAWPRDVARAPSPLSGLLG
jgi:hypothetical protein